MRYSLTWMSALLICGCLGGTKPDLLEARLREQQDHLVAAERRIELAQTELQRVRREADQLRSELARSGKAVMAAEYTESLVRASKLQINSLLSGGLNRDDQPGDDALVAYLSLVDDDGEVIKLPGAIQLTLIDPALPEPSRQIGQWRFTAEECRTKWTRGFTGAGYQFTVPIDQPLSHEQQVLNVRMTTSDNRVFEASAMLRVRPSIDGQDSGGTPLLLDDINSPPPPAAASNVGPAGFDDEPDLRTQQAKPAVQESTNWMKDDFPQRR